MILLKQNVFPKHFKHNLKIKGKIHLSLTCIAFTITYYRLMDFRTNKNTL